MPERAPVLRTVAMMMLKSKPGFPAGTIAAVPSGQYDAITGDLVTLAGTAQEWEKEKVAQRLIFPAPGSEESGAPAEALVVLCADKIYTSPALYPGDVFGADPKAAERHLKTGAAHLATPDDLKRFYDPNRGLSPEKQTARAESGATLAAAAAGVREARASRKGAQPEAVPE